MNAGVFAKVGQSYFNALDSISHYWERAHGVLKPVLFPIACVYSFMLLIISIIFYAGIVFDWLGKLTDWIRQYILDAMKNQSYCIDNSLGSFLFRPIFLLLLSPLLLASLLFPKLSSDTLDSFSGDVGDFFDGDGAFKTVKTVFLQGAGRLFDYVASTHLLLKPVTAVVAIVYSLILMAVGFGFALLIPLDWLSRLVEITRQWIASTAYQLQQRIYQSFMQFMLVPPLMIVLAPLFMLLLIIPKLTSQLPA
jgi:hypothetical protein